MKILVLSCILASLAAIVMCNSNNYDRTRRRCMRSENVSETELKKFFDGGMKLADASQNIMCYMKCNLERRDLFEDGVFLENSTLNYFERVPALIPYPNITQRVTQCKTQRGFNECETAFKITMCLMGVPQIIP